MLNELKNTFKMRLQTFAEPTPEPTPEHTPEPTTEPTPEPTKTFTQDELDRIVADRLARAQKKYGDYDDIKAKLTDLEKAEEERKKAQMSEQERLQAEKDEAIRLAKEKEEFASSTIEKANARLVKSEFKLLAKDLGIRADALEDAFILADKTSVKVDEDGAVDGVKEAIEALIQAKPYLVEQKKQEPKTIGNPSNPAPESEVKTLETQLADAKAKKDFSKVVELSNKIKQLLSK